MQPSRLLQVKSQNFTISSKKSHLRTKLMSNLIIRSRRYEHSMTRPPSINSIQRLIILRYNQHFLMMLLPHNTNQPVIQKRQVRMAHRTHNYRTPVLRHKRRRFSERVGSPFRLQRNPRITQWRKQRRSVTDPWREDAEKNEESEEEEKRGAVEKH